METRYLIGIGTENNVHYSLYLTVNDLNGSFPLNHHEMINIYLYIK